MSAQAKHLSEDAYDEVAERLWEEANLAGVPFMTRTTMVLFLMYLKANGLDAPFDVEFLVKMSGLPTTRTRRALQELAWSPWPDRVREELRAVMGAG